MFCPQCGSTQPDDLKFCKACGANLQALRQILANRDPDDKFDWSKTWVAEMFMSGEEATRKAAEIERLQGITPEIRRNNEIKAGVITASVGAAITILLFVLMGGIIESGRVSDAAAAILSRIWVAGLIPIFVGAALIFNGMYISKRSSAGTRANAPHTGDAETTQLPGPGTSDFLPPADTNELFPAGFSVTDATTRHLKQPRQK